MDTPSLKVFKTRMDGALSNLFIPVNFIFCPQVLFPIPEQALLCYGTSYEFAAKKISYLSFGGEVWE